MHKILHKGSLLESKGIHLRKNVQKFPAAVKILNAIFTRCFILLIKFLSFQIKWGMDACHITIA